MTLQVEALYWRDAIRDGDLTAADFWEHATRRLQQAVVRQIRFGR